MIKTLHEKELSAKIISPQQNGVPERMNHTIMECERSMLNASGLDNVFWEKVVNAVVYLINKSPTTTLDGNISKEFWCDKLVDYSYLHISGCDAFSHVPKKRGPSLTQRQGNVFFLIMII